MLVLSLIIVASCSQQGQQIADKLIETDIKYIERYSNLPQNEAGNIVRKSIETSGNWDNWTQKRSLSYTKLTTFYDSLGDVKRVLKQLHQYNLFPSFKARITWNENGKDYMILNNGQQAWKLEDGVQMTDQSNVNSAYNSSYGSHYVMSMPYKLADPGCQLQYEGKDTLPDGREALRIKVTYAEGAGSSAKFHTWWYLFNPESMELVANILDDGRHVSYTQYESFAEVEGLKFNKARASYNTDSAMANIILSSRYENEDISFGEVFPVNFFEPSK